MAPTVPDIVSSQLCSILEGRGRQRSFLPVKALFIWEVKKKKSLLENTTQLIGQGHVSIKSCKGSWQKEWITTGLDFQDPSPGGERRDLWFPNIKGSPAYQKEGRIMAGCLGNKQSAMAASDCGFKATIPVPAVPDT